MRSKYVPECLRLEDQLVNEIPDLLRRQTARKGVARRQGVRGVEANVRSGAVEVKETQGILFLAHGRVGGGRGSQRSVATGRRARAMTCRWTLARLVAEGGRPMSTSLARTNGLAGGRSARPIRVAFVALKAAAHN